MKRYALLAFAGLSAAVGSVTPDEPAGACSLFCPPGMLELELVEVRLVEAVDPRAEAPEPPVWAETGQLEAWGSVWFDDNSWVSFFPEPEPMTEEVE